MSEFSHRRLAGNTKPESVKTHARPDTTSDQELPLATLVQRAQLHPQNLTSHDVLQLQRTFGNRAVGQLLAKAEQPQLIKQVVRGNRVQRMIHELWNLNMGQPNKKAWTKYSTLISQNWTGINNDSMATPIVSNLIQKLQTVTQLDLMANSKAITKAVYEHYQVNPTYLHDLVAGGATRKQLEVSLLVQGERAAATADNLDWFFQNYQPQVKLSWSEWFPYTKEQTLPVPTYDAEIYVNIGAASFGVIHIHYPTHADNADIDENAIERIHVKRSAKASDKSILPDAWKGRCQTIIDAHVAARPM